MLFILMLCLVAAAAVSGFFAGHAAGRSDRLPGKDRAELKALRAQQYTLSRAAAEHVALGEPFASIVLDEIEQTRRKSL